MKIQPLYDLQQDINRLFIAGSKFAKGDPRLQKHIVVFNKLGEKAPVFKKIATDLEDLLGTETLQSPEKLMNISSLLYSILYTQGEQVEEGAQEKEQIPNVSIDEVNTEYSYLQLKSVIDALTSPSSGRLDILEDAFERNIFNDSRTFPYLDLALGDKYSELADYVENTIIPQVGKSMIPFLLQNFSFEDKTKNVRRLKLLNRFGYSKIKELTDNLLNTSLELLRAETVLILAEDVANEETIIQLAEDKNRQIRELVYNALAKLDTQTSLEKLRDIYHKNANSRANLPLIARALATSKLPFAFQEIFNQVVDSFHAVLALDDTTEDKVIVETFEKFIVNLKILENKDNPDVLTFILRILTDKKFQSEFLKKKNSIIEDSVYYLTKTLIGILATFKQSEALDIYEKGIHKIANTGWERELWVNYFNIAVKVYSPAKIFDTFSPQLANELNAISEDTFSINTLFEAYACADYDNYSKDVKIDVEKIDKRWGKLLSTIISKDKKFRSDYAQGLVILNALEPDSQKLDNLLIELTKKIPLDEQFIVYELLISRKVKGRFEAIFKSQERISEDTYLYAEYKLSRIIFWSDFPKEYADKFRKLSKSKGLDIYMEIAEKIEQQ